MKSERKERIEVFEDKYANSGSISYLWQKINKLFVRKDGNKVLSDNNFSDADKAKLNGIEENANHYELPIASAETLGGVRIGKGLDIDEHGIVTTVVNPDITMKWSQITNTPSTLAGYGITDAATKEELEEVEAKLSNVFKYKGSVATYADLEEIEDPEVGDVYNVIETEKNYAWSGTAWDDLGGIVDLSNYWSKEDLIPLTREDIDEITGSASTVESFLKILAESNEVMLDEDLSFSAPVTIDKAFTIDLNGQEIKSVINTPLFNVNGGTLTLKGDGSVNVLNRIGSARNGGKIIIEDGFYVSGDVGFDSVGVGSRVTFNGGELTAVEGGIGSFDGAEIVMNGGEMSISDNFGLFTNGTSGRGNNTITMNGGSIVSNIKSAGYEACGIYIANNDTFIMNGGSVTGNGGCGLLMRGGTVVINDGAITAIAGTNVPGWVGDNKTKMNASGIIYHESANYPGKEGINLTVAGGVITGVDHSIEILSNEATPNVTVTGGVFSPAYPEE